LQGIHYQALSGWSWGSISASASGSASFGLLSLRFEELIKAEAGLLSPDFVLFAVYFC
jgi:hypothetical protein